MNLSCVFSDMDSSPPPDLFCSEDASGCFSDDDPSSSSSSRFCHFLPPPPPSDPSDVAAALSLLVQHEHFHLPLPDYLHKLRDNILDPASRQTAVRWLFQVRENYNFGPLTAALSVNYLDRFLSRHHLPDGKAWMLQLVSVACLSLAAKMEETDVPLLVDLQVGSDYVFESRTIQRMELLVLSTLDWRMSSVTPFSYISYFIQRFNLSDGAQCVLRSRSHELILCALKELVFLDYRPSSIAAAAALCAIQEMFPGQFVEYKKILFAILPSLDDSLEGCFLSMLELFLEPFYANRRNEYCAILVPQSPVGVLDASFSSDNESTIRSIESSPSVCISSPVSKKRKVDDSCSQLRVLDAL